MDDQELLLPPTIIIIFGITGDLAKRKVLPAIYHLAKQNILSSSTKIIGISRQNITIDEMLEKVNLCVLEKDNICDPEVLRRLHGAIEMFQLNNLNDEDYIRLEQRIKDIETEIGQCADRLIYLSIPPQVYSPIIQKLGQFNLNKACQDHDHQKSVRLLVEKPFGYDIESAQTLISNTEAVFEENQIFRIDHYLAKESAKNILRFRSHNPIFSKQWDSDHISHIHVIAKEEIGIENRVNFYEQVGALRDLIQSHLIQLLALCIMELPQEITSDEVHANKSKILQSLSIYKFNQIPLSESVVRGQYESYQQEVNNKDSKTETFTSILLQSSEPRWANTSFQLTTGKCLDQKETVIKIYFGNKSPNILSLRVQPNEGIDINLQIEEPGFKNKLTEVKMNFSYHQSFDNSYDAYERVLVDAIKGEHMLFATKHEVMASWRLFQPILDNWSKDQSPLHIYPNNSAGPDLGHLAVHIPIDFP